MAAQIDWDTVADLYASRMVIPTAGDATWVGPSVIKRGPLSELVRHVMIQPARDQNAYSIVMSGQSHIGHDEIAALLVRPDFPRG